MSITPAQEGALYARYILASLDKMMACLAEMPAAHLNWQPPVPDANSVYVLAVHTLGNVEENVLSLLLGRASDRDREREFRAHSDSLAPLEQHWQQLRPQIEATLSGVSETDLDREIDHRRLGKLSGRDVLLIVARHAAEHLGQIELTRDLARSLAAG